jgi:hypothetical protein
MNLYFGEPDSGHQLRRWITSGRRWLEDHDALATLPDPCGPGDIVAAIEHHWDGGWHLFARFQREREGELVF